MNLSSPEPIKHRDIGFRDPHPDPQQAQSALLVLADIEGILRVSIADQKRNVISISYNLSQIDLSIIEFLLIEMGFHLDNSLLAKIKRALYYFTEENQVQNLGGQQQQDHTTRDIFMRCYRCKSHGCRDERPDHWRKYL